MASFGNLLIKCVHVLTGIFRIPDLGQIGCEEALTKALYVWGKYVLSDAVSCHESPLASSSGFLNGESYAPSWGTWIKYWEQQVHLVGGWKHTSPHATPKAICFLWLSVSRDPIPRVSSSKSPNFISSQSLLYLGPDYRKGWICLFIWILLNNQISDYAIRSNLKEISTHIHKWTVLKGLWFYSSFNFIRTMTSYTSYKLPNFTHSFWPPPLCTSHFSKVFPGPGK